MMKNRLLVLTHSKFLLSLKNLNFRSFVRYLLLRYE